MINKLKEIRKEQNISGYELAKKINVSHSLIYMIESGARTPSMKLAKKIANFFQMSIDDIFFDDKSHKTLQNSEKQT